MIKFFRKIRQTLLAENKFSKYFIYAIGEILLVVVGILIALAINSKVEQNKKQTLRDSYIQSLRNDLVADVALLESQIKYFDFDIQKNIALSKRLSTPNTNIDSIIKIARYEFLPFYSPDNELNLNTYNSLISTGNIDLFSKELNDKIQNHNAKQLKTLKVVGFNLQLGADAGIQYLNKYPINFPLNGINGNIMNSVWEEVDKNELKSNFNGMLTIKLSNMTFVNLERTRLLSKTKEMIKFLDEFKTE